MTHAIPEIKAMEMQDIKLPQKVQLPNGVPLFLINEGVHVICFKSGNTNAKTERTRLCKSTDRAHHKDYCQQ